jgi:hypothetical protein
VTRPAETPPEKSGGKDGKSLETIKGDPVFSYNMDESKTPGGLKVRFKIRVATGQEAALWDARQNEAILELLRWAHKRRTSP